MVGKKTLRRINKAGALQSNYTPSTALFEFEPFHNPKDHSEDENNNRQSQLELYGLLVLQRGYERFPNGGRQSDAHKG